MDTILWTLWTLKILLNSSKANRLIPIKTDLGAQFAFNSFMDCLLSRFKLHGVLGASLRLYAVTLTTLFTVVVTANPAHLKNPDSYTNSAETTQQLQIGFRDSTKPVLKISAETMEFESTEFDRRALSQFVADQTARDARTVILSTDDAALLAQTAAARNLVAKNFAAAPLVLPTAESSSTSPFFQLLKKQIQNASMSIKNDKIGVLILTYTTAAETLVWIHSSHLSQFEQSSNAIYTIALALVFGLNKDSWVATTKPIQKFFRKIIKPATSSSTDMKDLTVRFLGNLTLAAVISSGRIPLLAMDDMIEKGISLQHFTLPLLLTVVTTTALFTWSEHLAQIDPTTHPITKFIFRRTTEIRNILLGTFATTAALLTPSHSGATPWIVVAGIGMVGALVYFNGNLISTWLESNPVLIKLKQRFGLQCRHLFAN